MKKLFLMALAVCLVTACEKPILDGDDVIMNDEGLVENTANTKKFTFTLKGDFGDTWNQTRGYMQADGKDLTDVWVLDYMDGSLVQQKHLSNTDEEWAAPTINLAYGSHHVDFVASRGTTPTLSTADKTITWAKPSDTFWYDYTVTVVNSSNGNRAVTLDRVVTKFKAVVNDALPVGVAAISITPTTWYYALNYQTGEATGAVSGQPITIDVPQSYKGRTEVNLNIFGLSNISEWNTDITIVAKDGDQTVLGSATIAGVPLKAGRTTEYSGSLFSSAGSTTISLNDTWATSVTGTW